MKKNEMVEQFFIYIMANENNSVLYIGVTNDLKRCVFEHKERIIEGFTRRYNIIRLVYYEQTNNATSAIIREYR
jgi:putative endonuclease